MKMRIRWVSTPIAMLIVAVVASGCGAGGYGEGPSAGGDQDRLTAEQIRDAGPNNLHDAVRRLRPRWLDIRGGRGGIILVAVDRTIVGGLDELGRMGVDMAASLQYVRGTQVAGAFSPLPRDQRVEAVIVVHTLSGPGND